MNGPVDVRKKPVVVQAWQLTRDSFHDVAEWCGAERVWGDRPPISDPTSGPSFYLLIKTLEGTHRADDGDWIIKGVKGEFYPCKPDIFDLTYELVG